MHSNDSRINFTNCKENENLNLVQIIHLICIITRVTFMTSPNSYLAYKISKPKLNMNITKSLLK